MIKVLHIVLSLEVGGLERVVLDLIKYRNKLYVDPYLCCITILGELGEKYIKSNPIPVHILYKKPGFRITTSIKIANIIRNNKINLIHTHNVGAHFYGALAGRIMGIPVIHTKHGRNNPFDKGEIYLSHISSKITNIICPVSEDAAKVCVEIEHINHNKLRVIKNGIDSNIYGGNSWSNDIRKELKINHTDILCGIVARLSEEKDHETLIRAFNIIANKRNNVKLIIVGDGILRESIKSLINSLGLNDVIYLLGSRDDVPDILKQIDLFVLSSVTEGIPMTLLEAMASGLPIIATKVGGNPEVIIDGVNGFLVPIINPICLSEKMMELIDNKELRIKMGIEGKKRVSDMFDISNTVDTYENIYRSLVSEI